MADIIESIHKITYEVDDAALQKAANAINAQLAELKTLNAELLKLQDQFARTSSKEIDALNKISAQLDNIFNKIAQSAGKTKGALEQIGSGLLGAITDKSVSDLKGNVLDPLIEGIPKIVAGGAGLAEVIGGVLTFSNVVSAAIAAIAGISMVLKEGDEKMQAYRKSLGEVSEESKKLGQQAAPDIANMLELKAKIEDTTLAYNKRLEAVNQLRDQYPGYFQNLSNEELLLGKVKDAYGKVYAAIIANARAKVLNKSLEENVAKLTGLKEDIVKVANKNGVKLDITQNAKTSIEDIAFSHQADENLIRSYVPKHTTEDSWGARQTASPPELRKKLEEYAAQAESLKNLLEQIKKNSEDIAALTPNISRATTSSVSNAIRKTRKPGPDIAQLPLAPGKELPIEQPQVDLQPRDPGPVPQNKEPYFPGKFESFLFGDTTDIEDSAKRHQEEIKKTADAYKSMAQVAANAFKTIYDAQVASLDAEIKVRQQRVDAATKLAERGNTEALKIEQDRLDATEKKRNDFARKQQIVNAALALSDAIVAVASAAAETGPGAIAVVPAVIAAIVAGYAAVSAATKESSAQAFAKGVIGFKGKGGPTDDANWVRISSGESVITADGTRKNRALLEAINKGANLMPGMEMLSTVYPMLKAAPVTMQQGYASKSDLSALEGKLDEVVNAIEDNRLRQNIFFNEHGVGIMTDKAISRERRRWK